MPWAFAGGPVDVGQGRFGRLDASDGAEVPGVQGLHLKSKWCSLEKSASVTFEIYQPLAGFAVFLTTPGPLSRIPLYTQ
jgi:hypothetical protein